MCNCQLPPLGCVLYAECRLFSAHVQYRTESESAYENRSPVNDHQKKLMQYTNAMTQTQVVLECIWYYFF